MDDLILEKKLKKVITKRELDDLKQIVIFREDNGSYNLYDKYIVQKNDDGTYTVYVLGTHTEKQFYKLKNAVAWCSFDKRNLFKGAKRLHQLDQMVFSMDTEIHIHTKLLKSTANTENKLIYLSKLTQNKAKKRSYSDELQRYIEEYQRWQLGLFEAKPKY